MHLKKGKGVDQLHRKYPQCLEIFLVTTTEGEGTTSTQWTVEYSVAV